MTSATTRYFPRIETVFNTGKEHPHSFLYNAFINNTLMRLLPTEFSCAEKNWEESAFLSVLHSHLPLFKCSQWDDALNTFSLLLLTRYRYNATKFFYEMISRWLLPGRRLNISSFCATDFLFADFPQELYTISEMVVTLESSQEIELIRCCLPIIESELKLGLVSVYHANRILEIKGLSSDEKTSLIQERITFLLEKRPADFNYDIFNQMQHFLVMCGEEFKTARSYTQMSRMISIFYIFQKILRESIEKHPEQRFVLVKLSKTQLHLPLGVKKVLCLFVGFNFLSGNELFEQRHLMSALKTHFPGICPVEESYLVSSSKEEKIQVLYLEVEKGDGTNFSLQEMRHLRMKLADEVKNGVEKLIRPVFMPRNEEEVIRNIITLSKQLRYPKDLPQVIISFDEQTECELLFTIILVRILNPETLPLQELFEKSKSFLRFIPERVKKAGMIRKRYVKEAAVFHVALSAYVFIRPDHSIDLFKARQEVLNALQCVLGEVRDYNGGMIAKQHEQFLALKALFPSMEKGEDLLLENLFHSIFPVESRSFLEPSLIKICFTMLLEIIDEKVEGFLSKQEKEAAFFLLFHRDLAIKQAMNKQFFEMHLPVSRVITISLPIRGDFYFGYIYLETDEEKQKEFIDSLTKRLNSHAI